MDIDLNQVLQSLEAGIGLLPSAMIAVVLLSGPTVLWLLYRFVVQPRTSRYRPTDGSSMWVCPDCRSVNELRFAQCYRCDFVPGEEEILIIDPDLDAPMPFGLPTTATTGTAVGPGRTDLTSLPGLTGMTGVRGVTASETRPAATGDRDQVPVGPGRPRAARPRRAVVAGRGRRAPAEPDDPSAA